MLDDAHVFFAHVLVVRAKKTASRSLPFSVPMPLDQ
jgi:hypothetical protein